MKTAQKMRAGHLLGHALLVPPSGLISACTAPRRRVRALLPRRLGLSLVVLCTSGSRCLGFLTPAASLPPAVSLSWQHTSAINHGRCDPGLPFPVATRRAD